MRPQEQLYTGLCTEVVDGDTLRVRHNDVTVTLRLARVNAPEVGHYGWFAPWQWLYNLAINRYVTYTVVARDTYGRFVAEVWVGNVHVNNRLHAAGYR